MVNATVSDADLTKLLSKDEKSNSEMKERDTMAEGMMSPSDVAVMMSQDKDGWGSGMGFMWIFALLILANGGFGGWGGGSTAAALGYENLATSNEVQRGFDFQNSMANEREILAAVNQNSLQGMQNANQNTQYMMNAFNDKYNELQRDIAGVTLLQQQAIANQSECCCNTLRAIDGVNYNNAMNTAAINANTTAQIQSLKDMIQGNEMQRMQNQINQLELQNAVAGVVRYPTSTAYNAGYNPFCNCGNCMG